MAVLYMRTKDGGFLAGDTDGNATAYAYPSSAHSDMAKRKPSVVARLMAKQAVEDKPYVSNDEMRQRHARWMADLQQHGTLA